MQGTNGSQAPSQGPDFNNEFRKAQASGDFAFVMDTAKKSHRLLTDFAEVIRKASYLGRDAQVIAMGLQFLDNMIANSAGQISALKQAEKQTRDALKAAKDAGPEQPAQPSPNPPEPGPSDKPDTEQIHD